MIVGLIPYDASTMEYTHYDNIQGMCMTRDQYFACFARGPEFPTEAHKLAKLAARMIKTGFVQHREFESCFEMGYTEPSFAYLRQSPRLLARFFIKST
ncbi:MAG: hypothetical protein COB08_004545 [Rhodobacteraceae bacterium]|nr:hypothetical protein [Paracoccaceae bacterium]